jgi:hypothetical protein
MRIADMIINCICLENILRYGQRECCLAGKKDALVLTFEGWMNSVAWDSWDPGMPNINHLRLVRILIPGKKKNLSACQSIPV